MSVDFKTISIPVPSGTGRRRLRNDVEFSSSVNRAAVTLNGFKVDFANTDHHINVIEIDTDLEDIHGNVVFFAVECQYADKNFDDSYSGYVTVTVMADRD